MTTYILFHARWLGPWCWLRVASRLRDLGHTVHTPERPDFQAAVDLVRAQPTPPVLVGHSSAGMTISAIAELLPDQVGVLVYASAFLMPTGMSTGEFTKPESGSILRPNLVVDEKNATMSVGHAEDVFFNDCTPEDVAWAVSMLRAEPLELPKPPDVRLTDANFGRVPRVYVECTQDNAMHVSQQRRMQDLLPCKKVYRLPAGHTPFLSMPDELVDCLLDAAKYTSHTTQST
ncbi:alpha/beta fold hydrolase [Labedaea rhizosphaerae]|uniref:Pimeloyl-ACP methyl ester carboxylesterase n=1 Tax=Labedaea rhizosphaerae TaxID=598644 RepID=A0A4R6RR36_LABRH|nr:alpha/beta fold hydrolase [Labedaea rhizosphaerae]TDP89210.1 pimeloyl-ACP methyl ester carboxylesterase [Labedaea rhizosphaerae]